jgi:hypothetical protein
LAQFSTQGSIHEESQSEVLVDPTVAIIVTAIAMVALIAKLKERTTQTAKAQDTIADGASASLNTGALDAHLRAFS